VTSSAPSPEPRLAGTILLDQMAAIIEAHGESVLTTARATLPTERQRDLDALTPISWVDVHLARDLKNAVALGLGRDPIEFQRWVVHAAVGHTIHKFWRILLARVWDGAIVTRTPVIYAKTFDRGVLCVASYGDRAADLVLTGWSTMPEYDAIGLSAGIEAVLEYSGRKNARVRFARKDDAVTFHLTWRR
jgi:hypothetical protein